LKEKYKDKIKVYLGVEQDFLSSASTSPYDYVIGSVHTLVKNGARAEVDGGTYESRLENVNKLWGGDPYAFVEDYFLAISEIYEKTRCDIIGHFDIVNKFNQREGMFDEKNPRYIAAAEAALEKSLKARQIDYAQIKNNIKDELAKFIYKETKRKPMILPVLMDV
jgi:histidinol-phosphatase (PHP family)